MGTNRGGALVLLVLAVQAYPGDVGSAALLWEEAHHRTLESADATGKKMRSCLSGSKECLLILAEPWLTQT